MRFGDPAKQGKALAAHLKRKSAEHAKRAAQVVPIGTAETFGVISGPGQLLVRYQPKPGEKPDEIDLEDWLDKPELALAFAHFMAWWGPGKTQSTRINRAKSIRYFLTYLRKTEAVGFPKANDVSSITTEIIETYVSWLDGKITSVPSWQKPLKPSVKTVRLNALKEVVGYWRTSERYASSLQSDIHLPRNQWPGGYHQIDGTQVLDPISLAKVRKAAITEVEADIKLREDIAGGERRVKRWHNGKRVWEIRNARLHMSPRTLVPYIVLIGIDTTFNAEGLLGLSWNEIKDHPIFGKERWQIAVPKRRGTVGSGEEGPGRHIRSFPTGLATFEATVNLLKLLERFTEATRAEVEEAHRKRVFLFQLERNGRFRSYQATTLSEDRAWRAPLKRFIKDNELPSFTLRTLRATGGDIVNQMSGDIKDQQMILGHATPGTTLKSYRSGPAKQRGEEALAEGMSWNQRLIDSGGKSDTRNGSLMSGGNSAATPGFACLDPMNSPIPGQRPGKRCSAFGACPICPLAALNKDDPRAYARVIQLREKLSEVRVQVDPARYMQSWAPQRERLDTFWIPAFSERGQAGASLVLPPFPDLE